MITQNLVEIHNPHWQERSRCKDADPAIFFSASTKEAKKVCNTCPVIEQCLIWVLKLEATLEQYPQGFYAGTTPTKRSRMKLCVFKDCFKPRIKSGGKTHFRYCSEEHHKAHLKFLKKAAKQRRDIRENIDSPINPREYHMRGKVRSA